MRSAVSVLAAALALAAGTGCTGGDGQAGAVATTAAAPGAAVQTTEAVSTRPEPPADQSRWAQQVDRVCGPLQDRIDEVPPPTDAASLRTWSDRTLPLLEEQIAALKAVRPPVKDEEARNAQLFVGALESLEGALNRFRAALRKDDSAAVQAALAEASSAGAQARSYAAALGVTACGGYAGG